MTLSTELIRDGRSLRATPLPYKLLHSDGRAMNRINNKIRLAPQWVLLPGTKVPLEIDGLKSPKQIIVAAEVASQISAFVLTSNSRVREIVMWRHAAMVLMRQAFPKISYPRIGYLFNRDHTSVLHAVQKHEGRPDRLASRIEAIKEVLV